MSLVLTSCTNRKRVAASRDLTACGLPSGDLRTVASVWKRRLRTAAPVASVTDLYCGRAFRTAQVAASNARAGLLVVSAGLGLIPADARVPSYSLTVVPGSDDCILARISGRTTASDWWGEASRASPFATRLDEAALAHRGPILCALSVSYLVMIADDLLGLSARTLDRLRIFTLSPKSAIPEGLCPFVMPYDLRFDSADSPVPGTRGDFAQRALGHFVDAILPSAPKADFDTHADAVERFLCHLRPRETPSRTKLSDPEIAALIHRHWEDASGQSSRMLRYLRDDLGIACEQSRFRDLFRAAKELRGGVI